MVTFDILFGNLRYLGFFDFLLPWALFSAITFGILAKSEAISKEVSVNGTISLAASFFIINYTPLGMTLGAFFTNLFGVAALIMGGLLVAIFFLGMAGLKFEDIAGGNKTAIGILLAFIALIVFLSTGGSWIRVDETTLATMFMIIVMAMAVMFLGSKSGD